jgi:ABC-type antimicrobial peptide transport system permease subunit
MYFLPQAQRTSFADPELRSREAWSHYPYNIVIWAPGNPPDIADHVRDVLTAVSPGIVLRRVESYRDVISRQFSQQHMIAGLSRLFGGIGLLLAAVGLYGLMAYGVEQQTVDIGVRMALGARRQAVVAMVVRRTVAYAGIGLAFGIPAAMATGRLMTSQLFGVRAWDPAILFFAPLLLILATLVASAVPARRAATVDPMMALRAK